MFEHRSAASREEVRATFGGVRVGSREYVEDPDTGAALVYGDYASDRATHIGFDVLRWQGLVLGVDWVEQRGAEGMVVSLSRPGQSSLAEDYADVPYVLLSSADQRAALRTACEATLARRTRPGQPVGALRVADGTGRERTVADHAYLPLPAPTPVRPAAPSLHDLRPQPPRTHDTARSITLVDSTCREAFDYRAAPAEALADTWTIEPATSAHGSPQLVVRATRVRPATGTPTSRLVTRAHPAMPAPPAGPRVTYHERSCWLRWGDPFSGWSLGFHRTAGRPALDTFVFSSASTRALDVTDEQRTAIRAACEAVLAYEALLDPTP